jgi:hypothetical protein
MVCIPISYIDKPTKITYDEIKQGVGCEHVCVNIHSGLCLTNGHKCINGDNGWLLTSSQQSVSMAHPLTVQNHLQVHPSDMDTFHNSAMTRRVKWLEAHDSVYVNGPLTP